MSLFIRTNFVSASGLLLRWKIECDALTHVDWAAIADICGPGLPKFGRVIGVPRGGLSLSREMERYCQFDSLVTLIVDDVWTTGNSMAKLAVGNKPWIGFVAFARGKLSNNVFAFMKTEW